jgi:ADP-heptose:LPS heptosyltransferase
MNTRTKRVIDRWIGFPLCVLLNVLASALGLVLHRDHRLRPNPRVIVVSKYLGMGSVINAMPLIRALRLGNPESTLVFLGTPSTCEVARRIDGIDTTLTIDDSSFRSLAWTTLKALLLLWRMGPELFIDLEAYSKFSSIVATLSCARNRVGFFLDTTLFRRGVYTHLVYLNRFQHIRDAYGGVARAIGISQLFDPQLSPLTTYEAERSELTDFLQRESITTGLLVLVNPNAGDLCLERRWPAESFKSVIERLASRKDVWIILVGSSAEAEYTWAIHRSLTAEARERVRVGAGRLSLGAFLALLEKAAVLISNDSGPFHLAQAMGTRTVSLWGPGTPRSYGPIGRGHVIIQSDIYCSPCLYLTDIPPCGGDNKCMQMIPVRLVLDAVEGLLDGVMAKDGPDTLVASVERAWRREDGYEPGVVQRRQRIGLGRPASRG